MVVSNILDDLANIKGAHPYGMKLNANELSLLLCCATSLHIQSKPPLWMTTVYRS